MLNYLVTYAGKTVFLSFTKSTKGKQTIIKNVDLLLM